MVFQEVGQIKDILSAEGTILAIRENVDPEGDPQKERLYLMARCDKKNVNVYTKVNNTALELFFQGRISIKELFLLRMDEPYIVEENNGPDTEIIHSLVFPDDVFLEDVIDQLNGANQHYYAFSKGTRQQSDPYSEVLKIIDLSYENGVNGPDNAVIQGKNWIENQKLKS